VACRLQLIVQGLDVAGQAIIVGDQDIEGQGGAGAQRKANGRHHSVIHVVPFRAGVEARMVGKHCDKMITSVRKYMAI
jgi:hypothetical protein